MTPEFEQKLKAIMANASNLEVRCRPLRQLCSFENHVRGVSVYATLRETPKSKR